MDTFVGMMSALAAHMGTTLTWILCDTANPLVKRTRIGRGLLREGKTDGNNDIVWKYCLD